MVDYDNEDLLFDLEIKEENESLVAEMLANLDEEEEDAHFGYRKGSNTTCLFCADHLGNNFLIPWRESSFGTYHFPPNSTIRSSSRGLLLYYNHSTSSYSIDNPFSCNSTLPYRIPQRTHHHPDETDAVLVTQLRPESLFHIVVCIRDPAHHIADSKYNYSFETYSADRPNEWNVYRCEGDLNNEHGRFIVPNSGISCGRWAYWLTMGADKSTDSTMVLRVDVRGFESKNPDKCPILQYMRKPGNVACDHATDMQLGTVGGSRVGLVVVDKTKRKVELYVMLQWRTNRDDEDDDEEVSMLLWLPFPRSLDVIVSPDMESDVEILGREQIKCREMPKPVKFQSNEKIEVLLMVGRTLLVWENSRILIEVSRVAVIGEVPEAAAPYVTRSEVAHVLTSSLPLYFSPHVQMLRSAVEDSNNEN